MRLSVVVPVKDDPPLFACVASLLACERGSHEVEFFVVDNGSAAAFREQLRALPAEVTVLDQPKPGQAAARNTGIGASTGEVVFFTDADCRVEPGWLLRGLEGLEATGADILRGESGVIVTTPASRAIEASFAWRKKWVPGQAVNVDTKNLAVRRKVLDQVRFNEDALRAEDVEFGRMAAKSGFRVAFWPPMRLAHEHEARIEVFLAKKIAGGWTGQRVAEALGDDRRRRGRRFAHRVVAIRPAWLRALILRAAIRVTLNSGRLAVVCGRFLPPRLTGETIRWLTLVSLSLGNLLYAAGYAQPGFREVLSGRLRR